MRWQRALAKLHFRDTSRSVGEVMRASEHYGVLICHSAKYGAREIDIIRK